MQSIKIEIEQLCHVNTLIKASETEDVLGTVLRIHLILEKFLKYYVELKRSGEIANYIHKPRTYSTALSLSVAFNLPLPLAKIFHHINEIRNDFSHEINHQLDQKNIDELAKKVNLLEELDPNFNPVENTYIEIFESPQKGKTSYGSGNLRIDFLLCSVHFYSIVMRWLVNQMPAQHITITDE